MKKEMNDIREHMASGQWFEAADIGLEQDRLHANETMRRFNSDLSLNSEQQIDLLCELFGALGEHSFVQLGAQVDYGYNIFIGERCFFNFNCIFLDGAPIRFGDDVWVGPNVTFATPLHPLLAEERNMRFDPDGEVHLHERNEAITVGSGVWIASNVTVNPGVTIGDGAVVGAGSVVTKNIPPRVIATGVPCKPVRAITDEDSIAGQLKKQTEDQMAQRMKS